MSDLNERLSALIDKYAPELEENGIRLVLKNRYFEKDVEERSGTPGVNAIFNSIDRARDHKEEKEKGYFYEKNKYRMAILTVSPIEKQLVKKDDCRDYAFLLRKVERAHIGLEPRRKLYNEDKLVAKMEKRILKIRKKSKRCSAEKVCKNTLLDAFRYALSTRYEYKEIVLGKELFFWELLFAILGGLLVIAFLVAIAFIRKLL